MHQRTRPLAIVALLGLAACQGGGNVSSIPSGGTSDQSLAANTPAESAQANATYNFPATAPQGMRIYVHLPLRNSAELDKLIQQQSSKDSPLYHHWLTPAQFRSEFGPTQASLNAAAAALRASGFKTTITSQAVVADAPQATVERTFGVSLQRRTFVDAVRQKRVSALSANRAPVMPAALSKLGAQVAGLTNLAPRSNAAIVNKTPTVPENRYSPTGGYFFDDLKQAYDYPSYGVENGRGTTIAIIGVSDFLDSDVDLYFGHEHLTPPTYIRRPVDGGPHPCGGVNDGDCDEISLDVQQAGGSAPGATFMYYGAPNTFQSFIDMWSAIVDDNKADVVSSSWTAGCELFLLPAYNNGVNEESFITPYHDIWRQGNAQGITFLNASGDFGATDCTNPAGTSIAYGIQLWADDPDVTVVGGTNLVTSYIPGSLQSTYVRENAYSDPISPAAGAPPGYIWGSGGGKSILFAKPLYQYLVNTGASTRTTPDISMHMGGCPSIAVQPCAPDRSFDWVAIGGAFYGFIGTSASTPEFAGLQAIQDATLHNRAGNANYLIYGLAAIGTDGNGPIFHNNIPGNNGYPSHKGYNYVVGNGTPYAREYALRPFAPLAGNPQTPSNP